MPILADLGLSRGRIHSLQRSFASGIRLPGTAGNYISTPDSVLNSITGDIDIRVYAKAVNWNTGAPQTLIGKLNTTGNQRSYRLVISATGSLDLTVCTDGLLSSNVSTVAAPGFVNNQAIWIRATAQMNDGAGHHVGQIFTSSDGVTWTSVANNVNGGTFATGPILNIFDSTALLEIGSRDGGTQDLFAGTVYYAEVRNGIDGPIAARFDSSQVQVSGSLLPASINGWTWNGTALYKRDDYVRLPGTSGNYLSFPDTVANSVTGDIDIRAKLSMDDWTPAATSYIVAKGAATGIPSYGLAVAGDGRLRIRASSAGVGFDLIDAGSTNPLAISDGQVLWVRGTYSASTGQGIVYSSPDGITWTSLGTTTGTPGTIQNDANVLEVGSKTGGTANLLAGNVYYAEVRNGINGPVVASWDGRVIQTPWTINGSGWNWEGSSFTGKPGIALSLPGISTNFASTPDNASLTVTDLDVRAKIALDDWGQINQSIMGNRDGVLAGFLLRTHSSTVNTLELVWGNGVTNTFLSALSLYGIAAGATKWVRVTLDVDNGASGKTVSFYLSDDGVAWTPLGGSTIQAGTTTIADSAAVLAVGNFGTAPLKGKVFYAELRNGIDGPIVAMFDPARMAKTGTRTPASTVQPGGSPNMLTPNQASIETDATGWAASTNAPTLARDTGQFLDGAASLSLTATAAGPADMAARTTLSVLQSVVPGKLYTAKASMRAATVGRSTSIGINFYDSAQVFISNLGTTNFTDVTTGWTEGIGVPVVAPANAAFAAAVGVAKAVLVSEVHNIDRVSLVEAAEVWTINGAAWDLVSAVQSGT